MSNEYVTSVNRLAVELEAAVKEVSSWSDGVRRNIDTQQAMKSGVDMLAKPPRAQINQQE